MLILKGARPLPETNQITLEAGESRQVSYTIVVPENASPGGHFGGIFIDRLADATNVIGAGVGFQVGSLLSIQVGGDYVEAVKIREFSTGQNTYVEPNVDFTVLVTNSGTVAQKPVGFIEIRDMLGNDVAKIDVNEEQGRALPKSERAFREEWSDESLRIGRYDATVSLVYGQQEKTTISRDVSFWIVPTKTLGIIAGVLLAGFVIFYLLVRMYVRRQLKKAGVASKKKQSRREKSFGERLAVVMIVILTLTLLALLLLFVFFA